MLNDRKPQILSKMEKMDNLSEHKVVMLQYFDAMLNQRKLVQFLMINQNVTYLDVLWYVEHAYIHLDGRDGEWHKEFMFSQESAARGYASKSCWEKMP